MKNNYFLLFLLLFTITTTYADKASFVLYNDVISGTDKHFTNGMALMWLSEPQKQNNDSVINKYILNPACKTKKYQECTFGISLNHVIITPKYINRKTIIYDDMPYAGYAGVSFNLYQWNKDNFKELRLEIGHVGKNSKGEQVQNNWHHIIAAPKARGWDNQIGNYNTLNSTLRTGSIDYKKDHNFKTDWFNQYGFMLGNYETSLFASSMYRIGQKYPLNFNVHYPYLKEDVSLLQIDENPSLFAFAFNVGINMKLIYYDIIMDKGRESGFATEKRMFQGSLYFGADLFLKNHKLVVFYQHQTPYTKNNDSYQGLGGFMYSYQF
jgi:lipid A 3-O-deacylase